MKSTAHLSSLLLVLFLYNAALASQNPALADAQLASARALFKQGRFQDAAAAYRSILKTDKSSASGYSGLVQSYLKIDDVSAADEASSRAVATLPQSALAHAIRGDVYFRQGLLADAESEYRAALKLDQKCARGLLGMGRIFTAVSSNSQAQDYFASAHDLDPDDGDALYYWAVLQPYPASVHQLEKHLAEYRSTPEEERREREFIELVRGIGERQAWVGPKEISPTEIKLELVSPRPGQVLGLGVHVKFNNSVNAIFLVDTGASWMTIPRKLAEKIGARKISDYGIEGVGDSGPASGYFAWVDKIAVGDVEFHDCVVHVATKNDLGGVDGVIGTDIFAKYSVTIDSPAHKLSLAPLAGKIATGNERVQSVTDGRIGASFSFGHILLLNTQVNSSFTGLFVLDSGANTSSISPQTAQRLGKLHEARNRVVGASGEVNNVGILEDAIVKFSAKPAPKQDLVAFDRQGLSRQLGTEVSGFIGFDMLSRMKVKIDYRDGIVEFEQSTH